MNMNYINTYYFEPTQMYIKFQIYQSSCLSRIFFLCFLFLFSGAHMCIQIYPTAYMCTDPFVDNILINF